MTKKKRITMAELAEELNLSVMTISSVLNNNAEKRRISPKTIRRVNKHIVSRGYVPYRHALDLKQGKIGTVGILYSGDLYSHLTNAYNRMANFFSNSPQRLELMIMPRAGIVIGIKDMIARCVSYLIWIHTSESETEFSEPVIKNYLAHVTPIIYNANFASEEKAKSFLEEGYYLVGINRKGAYEKLAGFLKGLGHHKIIIPGLTKAYDIRKKAFEEAGYSVYTTPSSFSENNDFESYGIISARESVEYIKNHGVTAVCYPDDMIAGFALSEFNRMRIAVPEILTVTGFDGLDVARAFHPQLTTLKVPVEKMVACVEEIISGRVIKRENIFEMELIKGKSHASAKK